MSQELPPQSAVNPFVATTENVTIAVRPLYLDGESDALARKFVFAYFVRIENHRGEPVQLLRRRWVIKDGNGEVKEVEGEGVVGVQPVIPSGGAHEYSSFSILPTLEGSMEGRYQMQRPGGELFEVTIPRFVLRGAAN